MSTDKIVSPGGKYELDIQDDGNLVIYRKDGSVSWALGCDMHPLPDEPPPPPPPVEPLPTIRVSGTRFYDAITGATWKYRGCSAFKLPEQFMGGLDIGPFCRWARRNEVKILRVLGMYNGSLGSFRPSYVGAFYVRLGDFFNAVATYGLSVEFVVFADVNQGAAEGLDLRDHYRRVRDILRGRKGALLEQWNEPFKNGYNPTVPVEPVPDLAQATGWYDVIDHQIIHADYLTLHGRRDDEWPRYGAKDCFELTRQGLSLDPQFVPLGIPGVNDEPYGIGRILPPPASQQRSLHAQDHGEHAAACMLLGAGHTIHGTFGIECRVPDVEEQTCVDAIVKAWDAVPVECQMWTYTRGGLGDCPLEDNGLRTYVMLDGNRAVAVRIRSTAPPVARDGWRIIDERGPQNCVVELAR